MKRYVKAASYKGIMIPKMTVSEFLNEFEFEYEVRYSYEFEKPCWKLIDLQGANLGGIDDDEFFSIDGIVDRLGVYYDDYLLDEDEYYDDYNVLLDDMIKADPSAWQIPYIYYVLHPDELIIDKPLIKSVNSSSNIGNYPYIDGCADAQYLYDNLSAKSLSEINDILQAYSEGKIDFIEPRFDDGEPDFTGEYELIINDPTYKETGNELLVMQWVESHEDTGYLVECYQIKEYDE